MFKKTVSVLLAVLMVFGIVPFGAMQAFAAETGSKAVSNDDEAEPEEYQLLEIGSSVTVAPDDGATYRVVPGETRMYAFYSTGSCDTEGVLYDENMGEMAYNDDGGEDYNFRITAVLDAGKTYYIRASLYSGSGSFELHAETVPYADSISIDRGESISGYAGTNVQLQVRFDPENSVHEAVAWSSSDGSIASVNPGGLVSLLAKGSAVITASVPSGLKARITVNVIEAESISVGETKTVNIAHHGDVVRFAFTAPESRRYLFYATGGENTYGSCTSGAVISGDVQIAGDRDTDFRVMAKLEAGKSYFLEATIPDWGEDYTGSYNVAVAEVPYATALTIEQGSAFTGYVGYRLYLSTALSPSEAVESISWESSDPDVASVSYGTVSFNSPGTATVTATTENGVSASIEITVKDYEILTEQASVTADVVSAGSYVLIKFTPSEKGEYAFSSSGASGKTYAEFGELYDDYQDQEIYLYSEPDNDFSFRYRLEAGQTYYLRTGFDTDAKTGTYQVGVIKAPAAKGLSITQGTALEGSKKDVISLSVTFTPEGAASEDITWTSSDESVASVDDNGRLELLDEGTALITATSESGLSASCTVTVKGFDTIVLNETKEVTISQYGGQVYFAFVPGETAVYNFFSSGDCDTCGVLYDAEMDELESNDDSGEGSNFSIARELTKGGTYYIMARMYGSAVGSFELTVQKRLPANALVIREGTEVEAYVGDSGQLHADFLPDGAIPEAVTWSSSDYSVADVDGYGFVTLRSEGTATVTATSESGLTASITATVTQRVYDTIALDVEEDFTTGREGDYAIYQFVPEETLSYVFSSKGDESVKGTIYDSNMYQVASSWNSGGNFNIKTVLEAGETYYLRAELLDPDATGSFSVLLTKAPETLATVIGVGETKTAEIDSAGKKVLFRFTPATTAQYVFTTSRSNAYQCVTMYNDNMMMLNSNNGTSVSISRSLTGGRTYYIECGFNDDGQTGSFTLSLALCPPAEEIGFSFGDAMTAFVNTEREVEAIFLPENAVREALEWTSSDDGVVEIKDSYNSFADLSFKATGSATVTVTSQNGLTAAFTVNVKDYETLSAGETKTAVIENSGDTVLYKIVPAKDGRYAFRSSSDGDTKATLYDSDMTEIADDDDGGAGNNFRISASLTAGETYYLEARFFSGATGSFPVSMGETVYVTSLELLTLPDNTTCYQGAPDIDYRGLSLRIGWSDGEVTEWAYGDSMTVRVEQVDIHRNGARITVTCGDESVGFDVEVLENPVESLEITGEPVVLMENTGGEWRTDNTGVRYFHYSLYSALRKSSLTVHFKDGTDATVSLGGKVGGYSTSYTDPQHIEHFTVGGDNSVRVSYLGVTTDIQVTVLESPVEKIEVLGAPEESLIEHYNGEWRMRFNPETGESESYYYYWLSNLSDVPVRITYKDGTVKNARYGDWIDGYPIDCESDQESVPWTVGSENALTVSFMGKTDVMYITVAENPVMRLELVSPSANVLCENADGYQSSRYDDATGSFVPYFRYSLSALNDATVRIFFKNGESVTAHPGDYVDGYYVVNNDDQAQTPFALGENTYRISYLGQSCEATVTVTENPVAGIEVLDGYSVRRYENADGFINERYDEASGEYVPYFNYSLPDISDMRIRVSYKNGASAIVSPGEVLDGHAVSESTNQYDNPWTPGGDNSFTVTYMGCTAQVPVIILPNPVAGITVIKNTDKTVIENGDGYYTEYNGDRVFIYDPGDVSDAVIRIDYADGTSATAHIGDNVNGYRVGTESDQQRHPWTVGSDNFLTVTFMGREAQMPVAVVPTPLKSLVIDRAPTREYILGDPLFGGINHFHPDDPAGLRFTVTYLNGQKKTYTDDDIVNGRIDGHIYMLDYPFEQTVGANRVTFSYMGKSADYDVTVRENPVSGIEVVKLPDNPEYSQYYSPDFTGMKLKLTGSDGTSETVTLTSDNMIYGFSGNVGFYVGFEYKGSEVVITEREMNNDRSFIVSYAGVESKITGLRFRRDKTVTDVDIEDFTMSAQNMLIKVTCDDGTKENIRLTDIKDNCLGWTPENYYVRALTDKGVLGFYITNPEYAQYMRYDLLVFDIPVTLGDQPEPGYIVGDVDGNGRIDIKDVTAIQRHIAEYELLTGDALKAADTNGDGEVNIDDATLLQQYLALFSVTLAG